MLYIKGRNYQFEVYTICRLSAHYLIWSSLEMMFCIIELNVFIIKRVEFDQNVNFLNWHYQMINYR